MAEEPATPNPGHEEEDRGFFDLPDFGRMARAFGGWCRANPVGVALLVVLGAMLGYYYFGQRVFLSRTQTPADWISRGWSDENDQQHCYAVIPIAILLGLMRWRDLVAAPRRPSNAGLWWIAAGVLSLVAAIRCVEARYTIFALPLLAYGAALFLFGRPTARVLAFPIAFLLFMLPIGGLVQATAGLQAKTASVIQMMCNLVGVRIRTEGALIYSADNSFAPLEVAGGCSGIRSLMAMMMLAALYAYFMMRTRWRGFFLFSCSLLFALVGNFFRVFTIVLAARFIGPKAAHFCHDWSGFVFFPVAVMAMVGVGNLLNRDWFRPGSFIPSRPAPAPAGTAEEAAVSPAPSSIPEPSETSEAPAAPKPQTTYDY